MAFETTGTRGKYPHGCGSGFKNRRHLNPRVCTREQPYSEGVVAVYIDDILIYTRDLEEHHRVVRRVLKCLHEHKLYLKAEKCEFCKTKIEYLGMVISENTVEMDPAKVSGVRDWPVPRNVTEV